MRRSTALLTTAGLTAGVLAAAGSPASAASPRQASSAASADVSASSKHKSKLLIQPSTTTAVTEEKVKLAAIFQPETTRKVKFKKRIAGKKHKGDWSVVKNKTLLTNGFGYAELTWKPSKAHEYLVKAFAPEDKRFVSQSSKEATIFVGTKNRNIKANFPKKAYVDVPFSVPVTVKPKQKTSVRVQRFDPKTNSWRNEGTKGTKAKTNAKGKVTLTMKDGIAEQVGYRVVSSKGQISATSQVKVDGDWLQAFYEPPKTFPKQPGKLIRTMPMTGTVPTPTDPTIPTANLPAGTQQYRYLYTTMRYHPKDKTETPDVASGMVYMPDADTPAPKGYSKSNRPVIVWAHPTLGTAFKCAPSTGSAGYKTNYMDLAWWMSAGGDYVDAKTQSILPRPGGVLANGYVVVIPDYLSVATPGKETYLIGQQEANDIIYAAKAIQQPASKSIAWTQGRAPKSTWPGANTGNDFVVPGHSQGGHAALWTGANKPLAEKMGLNLLGTAPVAPASDLLAEITASWNEPAGWFIGPYATKTFVDNFDSSFLDSLTAEGKANYEAMANMCTLDAAIFMFSKFFDKNGNLTATFFKKPDMNDPTFANTWGKQLNAQTPIVKGMQSQSPLADEHNGYDKSLPTLLIQGQADDIVLAQSTAAMQDSMCKAGVPLDTYWPTANPLPIPGKLDLQANHLNILTWPVPDNLLQLVADPADSVTSSSTLAEWIDGVFQGVKPVTCGDKSWSVTSTDDGDNIESIHFMIPQGPCPTIQAGYNCATPSLDSQSDSEMPKALIFLTGIPTQASPAFGANTQANGVPPYTQEFMPGFTAPGLNAYMVSNQAGLYPYSASLELFTWSRKTNANYPGGFLYDNAGPTSETPWGVYPSNGAYYK